MRLKTAFSSFTRLTAGLGTVIWKPSEKQGSHDSWIRHCLTYHWPTCSFVICSLLHHPLSSAIRQWLPELSSQGQGACFMGLNCTKVSVHGSQSQKIWSHLI